MSRSISWSLFLLLALSGLSASVNATIYEYSLSDKDPGGQFPPDYGLRLDNLFGDGDNAHWTFSFEQFDVTMIIDSDINTAHISGDVVGGLDDNREAWEAGVAGAYIWELDFTFFDINITDPLTGFFTSSNIGNLIDPSGGAGTLTLSTDNPGVVDIDGVTGDDRGRFIGLADYSPFGSKVGNFAIGGPTPQTPYVSSWLADTTYFTDDTRFVELNRNGACCKDFGFRAVRVPEPGTLALLGSGLLGIGLFRRRRQG